MCLLEFGDWYSTSAWGTKCEAGAKVASSSRVEGSVGESYCSAPSPVVVVAGVGVG